jgi:Ca2+-binding EF-hand superfamily protein
MRNITNAIIAALLASGSAAAADAPEFTSIDKDKNGYVSREEARTTPEIMELFARVDSNKDGQLSAAEYSAAVKQLES